MRPAGNASSSPSRGGVDSAVAALIERERGADVVAVTLKLWADERTDGTQACCSPEAVRGARSLCHSLGIPHLTLDLETAFRREVVDAFVGGYRAGETPNPCVICNGDLRIDAMVSLADRLGASALATGHYARLEDDGSGPLLRGRGRSGEGPDLHAFGPSARDARAASLPAGRAHEARGPRARGGPRASRSPPSARARTCAFSRARASARSSSATEAWPTGPARSWTSAGRSSGEHPGHHHFTVGQRRGLGVATGEPVYVTGTDAERNRVVVGGRDDLARTTRAPERRPSSPRFGARDSVRLRYHAQAIPCRVSAAGPGEHAELELELSEPAYGVAPGQTACLYDGDLVVGRATIAGAA